MMVWAFYSGGIAPSRDADARAIFKQHDGKPYCHGTHDGDRNITYVVHDEHIDDAAAALRAAGFRVQVGGNLFEKGEAR